MAPPDLKDPVQRAAYLRELHGVARGVRMTGLWLAAAGLGLLAVRRFELLEVPLWIVIGVAGTGAMLMVTGVAARTRYHALRMRG